MRARALSLSSRLSSWDLESDAGAFLLLTNLASNGLKTGRMQDQRLVLASVKYPRRLCIAHKIKGHNQNIK